MELHSQQVRALAPESDPLKIGMGWTIDDLTAIPAARISINL